MSRDYQLTKIINSMNIVNFLARKYVTRELTDKLSKSLEKPGFLEHVKQERIHLLLNKKEYHRIAAFREEIQLELAVVLEENCRRKGVNFEGEILIEISEVEKTLPWKRGYREGIDFFPKELTSHGEDTTRIVKRSQIPAAQHWVFVVLSGNDKGRQYIGMTKEIKIGRLLDNHIHLRDPKVSRFHALIRNLGSQLILEDLQSTNGTQVNDVKVRKKRKLLPGDRIKVGETVIEVMLEKG